MGVQVPQTPRVSCGFFNMSWGEWDESPRIVYGKDEFEGATFVRVCSKCGRFVKPYRIITFTYDGPPADKPNAHCRKCGKVKMIFEGYL